MGERANSGFTASLFKREREREWFIEAARTALLAACQGARRFRDADLPVRAVIHKAGFTACAARLFCEAGWTPRTSARATIRSAWASSVRRGELGNVDICLLCRLTIRKQEHKGRKRTRLRGAIMG